MSGRPASEWSLGEYADLLWSRVPEARPVIIDLVARHLDEANRYDVPVTHVSPLELTSDLFVAFIQPCFDPSRGPGDPALVRRVIGAICTFMVEPASIYVDAYYTEIRDRLSDKDNEVLDRLCPELPRKLRLLNRSISTTDPTC